MPFDIVAFLETQQATALSGVAAVADDVYKVVGDDLEVKVQASWLAGILQMGVTTPKYCEIRQPSLKIPYRFYKSCLTTIIDHRTGYEHLWNRPLPLYAGEKLNVYLQNATDEYSVVALWLASGKCVQSPLDAVTPTHSITGYADSALSANVWNSITMTWDQDLPIGRYAVVGMRACSYLAAGAAPGIARIKLLDSVWRPGVITTEIAADKTNVVNETTECFDQRWPLMPEISFEYNQLPKIEFLSLTADTDHIVQLLLQKIR